jgi:biopolymer transport protein ExbD
MKTRKVDSAIAEPDMTPMIDIVFQLLTFFMIAVNFENTKADERVKLPVDALAKPPEVKLDEELLLNFGYNRRPDGAKIGDPVVFYDHEIPVAQMGPVLEQEAKFFQAKRSDQEKPLEDVSVIIRADADVPTGMVQELIEKAQEAGFSKFQLKAQQQQD